MSVRNSYSSGDNALSYASSTIRLGNNASVSAVSYVNVADVADYGDGRDLRVNFSPISNENNLSRYQVYVVKTSKANSFNLTQANSNRNYTTFYKNGSQISSSLNSDARDTDGDRIQQGVPYTVFVLSVSNSNSAVNNALSNGSQSITLSDSSVVQAVSNLSATISGNTGTFGDIQVSFTKPSNENNVAEYRILVIPSSESSSNYSVNQAINVAPGNYTSVPAGTTSGNVNSNDIYGASSVSGKTYEIRILTVGKDGKYALSSASNQIIVKAPPAPLQTASGEIQNITANSFEVKVIPPQKTDNIGSYTVLAVPSELSVKTINDALSSATSKKDIVATSGNVIVTLGGETGVIDTTSKSYNIYIVSNANQGQGDSVLSNIIGTVSKTVTSSNEGDLKEKSDK
jgi:hypothetical protein